MYTLKADLKKKSSFVETPEIVQNDNVRFEIEVTDNGKPLALSEVDTVSLVHSKRGQTVVTSGEVDENKVIFNLGTNETENTGRVDAMVQLYDEEGRVSTIKFPYYVIKDPTGEGYEPSEREQTLIEVVMSDAQAKIDELSQVDVVQFEETLNSFSSELAQKANREEVNTLNNEKADKSYVDSKTQAVSLAFKESFSNLSSLQTAYPEGDLYNHVVLSDGMIYTWINNEWVNTNILANGTGIANKTVSTEKTTFLRKSRNLFNKNDIIINEKLVIGIDEEPIFDDNWVTSGFIPIQSNTEYKRSHNAIVVLYHDNKNYDTGYGSADTSFTTSSWAKFLKVSVQKQDVSSFQLEEGNVTTSYEVFNKDIFPNLFVDFENLHPLYSKINNYQTVVTREKGKVKSIKVMSGSNVVESTTITRNEKGDVTSIFNRKGSNQITTEILRDSQGNYVGEKNTLI